MPLLTHRKLINQRCDDVEGLCSPNRSSFRVLQFVELI